MARSFTRYVPFVIAAIVLIITTVIFVSLVKVKCGGIFIYPIDDTYIHMAIAKNFSGSGVWGVTPYEFSSSSSTILWTLLLSFIFKLFGVNPMVPLWLNVIFGIALLLAGSLILDQFKVNPIFKLLTLLGIILFLPLPTLMFSGMEHTLHALISLVFVFYSARVLSGDGSGENRELSRDCKILLVLSPLIVMARFEGMFLLLIICVLLAIQKRFKFALLIAILGLLPIIVLGVISISHGWFFLPNPILIKAQNYDTWTFIEIVKFLGRSFYQFALTPHLLIPVVIVFGIILLRYLKNKTIWDINQAMGMIFILVVIIHLQFARIGWFFRYEAYLVYIGVVVGVISIKYILDEFQSSKNQKKPLIFNLAVVVFILLAISQMGTRGVLATRSIPEASKNIYEQQYQMGLFLNEFYEGEIVAVNDIGAANYLADIHCFDIWGLANTEIARARITGQYDTDRMDTLISERDVKIAIVYPHGTGQEDGTYFPSGWQRVGEWKIQGNIVCSSDTVHFYAIDPEFKENLVANLRAFSEKLPPDIEQTGMYMNE